MLAWASEKRNLKDATSAVNYLVLAIGSQSIDEQSSADYFQYAKTLALSYLGGDLGIETVQAFALATLYMLRACQINGAYLFFGKLYEDTSPILMAEVSRNCCASGVLDRLAQNGS